MAEQTNSDGLAVSLQYRAYGFGSLLAHLIVTSSSPVIVSQGYKPLQLEQYQNTYECDVALVRDEPLSIISESAHMHLRYSGNKLVQISEKKGTTLTTEGVMVIGGDDE